MPSCSDQEVFPIRSAPDPANVRIVCDGYPRGSDTDPGHRLTSDGAAIYDDIEAQTDALGEQLWSRPELSETVTALRPYVKSVIDAGVLPGTRKK